MITLGDVMPIYQYNCSDCAKKVDVFFRSVATAQNGSAKCPECGGTKLDRVMSTFARRKTTMQRLEDVDHVRDAAALQSNDPGAFAEWAKRTGKDWDEELGTNWEELAERVEAGEDPAERIDADYTFRYHVEEKKYQLEQAALGGGGGSDDPFDEYFDRPMTPDA